MQTPGALPRRTALLAAGILLLSILAGCTAPPEPPENAGPHIPPRTDVPWTNPFEFPVHFDGWRAYRDLLAHIYEDPEAHAGPRYRIPGTATHAAVADQLLDWLSVPFVAMGGTATHHNFTGEAYYALDLAPVERSLCAEDSAARDRVRDLTFTTVVGRTHPHEIGLMIGAHWDSKRHVDPALDPEHAHDPVLGADDGASGTVAVIELARAFARTPVDIPLTFLLFDGEDGFDRDDCHPLAGSLHYAQSLNETEQESAIGLILLDMVGNHTARYYREGYSYCYPMSTCETDSRWLGDHVWGVAAQMGIGAFVDTPTGYIGDDHISFLHEGIHAIDIIRYENRFPEYWHTARDDHTAVHPMGLHQVGHVVEASIRLLAEERADTDPE